MITKIYNWLRQASSPAASQQKPQKPRGEWDCIVPIPETFKAFPDEALHDSVWARFSAIATIHRHRPAVQGATSVWSYKQLKRKAATVCAAIQRTAPSLDQPIALLLRHEMKMLAAILGSVKAGRPYVFLDPSLPAERLRFLLANSGATLVIFHPACEALAKSISASEVKLLNLAQALAAPLEAESASGAGPDSALCINYTSGTTGAPSGIIRSHRALLANIRNMTNLAKIAPSDRLILCISPASGAAAMDIFGALLNGACVAPCDVRTLGVPRMMNWLTQQKISFFHAVPTLFRSLCKLLENGPRLPDLRFVLLGGEAVFRSDLESFQRLFPAPCIFQNVLGMTEGAGILCSYLANHRTRLTGDRVPVGYPVPGKAIKIVNERGDEVPCGEVGEIAVESELLSQGYVGQARRTSERYLDLPQAGYKRLLTRDLGRIRPEDHAVEWLGRMDSQLKVGGLRVSPTEVESLLLQNSAVQEAVVILASRNQPSAQGRETQLLAWILTREQQVIDPESLRQLLREHLPPEAIPARFIRLTELPLLANGKVDRQALNLDHPALTQSESRGLEMLPRNEIETVVAEAWQQALGKPANSIYDHFFEMGGDSLAAVNLLAQLSSHYGFELPGHTLLHHPTIAGIAEKIPIWRSNRADSAVLSEASTRLEIPAVVALSKEGEGLPLYILPGGQGSEAELLVFAQVLAHLSEPRPAFGLRISALSEVFSTMDTLGDIAAQMNRLCENKPTSGPWILVGECGAGLLAVEMARQLYEHRPESAPAQVILLDVRTNSHLAEIGLEINHGTIPDYLARYYQLVFSWEPKRFQFPLQLISSEAFQAKSADATLGWSNYTDAAITTNIVPGDHASYIRQHAGHVAQALEQAINAARVSIESSEASVL